MVADGDIPAHADGHVGDVARAEALGEAPGVRAAQLHLPLDRHIPHGDTVYQPIIFRLRIAIGSGHQHMIVDREPGDAVGDGGLIKWRGADTGGGRDDGHDGRSLCLTFEGQLSDKGRSKV